MTWLPPLGSPSSVLGGMPQQPKHTPIAQSCGVLLTRTQERECCWDAWLTMESGGQIEYIWNQPFPRISQGSIEIQANLSSHSVDLSPPATAGPTGTCFRSPTPGAAQARKHSRSRVAGTHSMAASYTAAESSGQ